MKTTPVIDTQQNHVTIRSFTEKKIAPEMLSAILDGGRRSPTSSNMQAYSIIVVKDPDVKQKLAGLAGNQKHVETCPVFLAFCADLHRLEQVCELHDKEMVHNLETFLISTIDASLVGMSVQTGAESFGLGAVMIGAIRNSPEEVADLLELPPHVYVVYGMCLGWPEPEGIPPQKLRLPGMLVVHDEKYNAINPQGEIRKYDHELAGHYTTKTANRHPAAWSGVIAENLSKPRRKNLKSTLEKLGFDLS